MLLGEYDTLSPPSRTGWSEGDSRHVPGSHFSRRNWEVGTPNFVRMLREASPRSSALVPIERQLKRTNTGKLGLELGNRRVKS